MARAIWSGSISFGLVTIPVKLFAAVRDRDIHFHLLSGDGECRLRRRLVCPETGEEFEYNETARGYELAPDQYVLVSDEELEKMQPEGSRNIDISDFVELDEIDPILFDRPYYLVPEEHGSKPYRLLLEALESSGKVAIARIVMRSREHLAAIRPIRNVLCLETMRFIDEVVPAEDLTGIPKAARVSERELEVADQLIEMLTASFEPDKYKDEYRERVRDLIEQKSEGKEIVSQEPVEHKVSGKVINLMEALESSLSELKGGSEERGGGGERKRGRKGSPKGSSKKRMGTKASKKGSTKRSTRSKSRRKAA